MSATPSQLLQLNKNLGATLPAQNAAFAGTNAALTDAAGNVQNAVMTGAENPPWSTVFSGIAAGAGTCLIQDVDSKGNPIGAPISLSFTEAGSPPPATFPQTVSATLTPVAPAGSASAGVSTAANVSGK